MRWISLLYINIFMAIFARALAGASRIDEEIQSELKGLPANYTIRMMVLPESPRFVVQVTPDHQLKVLSNSTEHIDLDLKIKHLSHAVLMFTFQEGVPYAFANDRVISDGEISHAVRVVRCIHKLEVLILPKFINQMIMKRYPKIGFFEKISKFLRIYLSVFIQMIFGNNYG